MNLRDTLERLWWTFVAAFAGTLTTSPVLLALIEALSATPTNIDIAPIGYVLISAAVAGIIAVVNLLALIARARLAVLPSPGDGLPGLPVYATGGVVPPGQAYIVGERGPERFVPDGDR